MKKAKLLTTSIALALAGVGAVSMLSGCGGNDNPDNPEEKVYFSFSIGVKSGRSVLPLNEQNESIVVYDNGVDTADRSYVFSSSDDSVATIDQNGKISPKKVGKVNFTVLENKSGDIKQLPIELHVVEAGESSKGGFNYAGASTPEELDRRAEILSKLEKYTMDTHLTGITLFDNGGYVRYSDRVNFPGGENPEYVTGYGFGLLTEGWLDGTLPGTEFGQTKADYLHSSIAQDSLKIDQYTATGSQVSDLASYITSSYWGTKLGTKATDKHPAYTYYDWYPVLAANKVTLPERDDDGKLVYQDGKVKFAGSEVDFKEPIPMEDTNDLGLYKKWRIYVKTDGVKGQVLKYHTKGVDLSDPEKDRAKKRKSPFDNRSVTIDDYEFIYKYLFTGSNNIIRGTEMANDSSYGIKGAQRYYNDTKALHDAAAIDAKWLEYTTPDASGNTKLGVQVGHDDTNGDYIDLELINAIDSFTAMYTLSSSLVSPLPEDFFVGDKAISAEYDNGVLKNKGTMEKSAKLFGKFNSGGDDAILDYTLCCGPYVLEQWLKNVQIVFQRNDDWFDYKDPVTQALTGRYKIPGVYNRVIDTSTDTEKNWKQFEAGNLDSAGVPSKKVKDWKNADSVHAVKGDSTFKLNVNSCTQEQWDYNFGPQGKINQGSSWKVKPWMSNSNFLNGLFYSINRKEFAENRGVTPSVNYFSDAYMADPKEGKSYNDTEWHKQAIAGYETFTNGESDYGYSKDKAIDCFRAAVKELSAQNKITLGTKDKPTEIEIHIKWMYQTDVKEYGEDIKSYFESAFNNDAVCGGKVKLNVTQDAVTNWEEVYNEWMMKGQFDLGFGAISGNTYNPLNFMEVLKSDNSSSFTLNWGADTSKVDPVHPIIYDGKTWSFDGLWEVADHGGIVEDGVKIDPVKSCYSNRPTEYGNDDPKAPRVNELYNGYRLTVPVEFAEYKGDEKAGKVEFDFSHLDVYVFNRGNITLSSDKACYNKEKGVITIDIDETLAQEINQAIKDANSFKDEDIKPGEEWKKNPFINAQLGKLFSYELYYSFKIEGGAATENYYPVKIAD